MLGNIILFSHTSSDVKTATAGKMLLEINIRNMGKFIFLCFLRKQICCSRGEIGKASILGEPNAAQKFVAKDSVP